jgi:DNA-directed RNA polymerase specialized sigma24 family protein
VENGTSAAEVHQALEEALTSLAPAERLLVKLRFEDDCGMEEIAEMLRLPSRFHAQRQLTSVLHRLRGALERRGIVESTP